ncbi:hypothetical protein X777_14462 [Ooceraea biroi]|uniref:Uncharacterized protein n=1 Tax=Ooceraea biroi TaxID=2015173 RepID=A0A026VWX9_OOCBI|nr:hypothetical protein X777_14462 [Ooceraea biroi]
MNIKRARGNSCGTCENEPGHGYIPKVETIDVLEDAEDTVYLPEEISCTSDEATISNDYKRQAVEYWKSGKTRSKSLEGVRKVQKGYIDTATTTVGELPQGRW